VRDRERKQEVEGMPKQRKLDIYHSPEMHLGRGRTKRVRAEYWSVWDMTNVPEGNPEDLSGDSVADFYNPADLLAFLAMTGAEVTGEVPPNV